MYDEKGIFEINNNNELVKAIQQRYLFLRLWVVIV